MTSSAAKGRKVLIIDDSDIQLYFEQRVLERAGFDVKTANSLAEFEHLLQSWWPDIVLTDVQMPDISGDQLCSRLKSRMATSQTPVVLFSSLPEAQLSELARQCGADGHLSKENGLERLVIELNALWESILW
jgi:two-component system, OmpR family, alkaline phosphatase synthesis response regulator PhoP